VTSAVFNPPDTQACVASPEYELFCAGRLDDPYPLLAWLREHDPVHFSPRLDAWIVTRYDDVLAGLLDRQLANDRVAGNMSALPPALRLSCAPLGEHVSNWLGFTDPPKHTRMRGLLRPMFTPALARRLSDRITTIVDELLTAIDGDSEVDLIAALAFPLPARVICELLGVPIEQSTAFHGWSEDMAAFTGNIGPTLAEIAPRAMRSYVALDAFMTEMVAERRRCPAGDVISSLAAAEDAGELSRAELVGLSVFTLVAGHETTASLLGTGLRALLADEELHRAIAADPELVPIAVEEMLRLEAPIQFSPRLTSDDVVIGDRSIPAGAIVMLHMAAANRDPAAFPEPDRLRLDRDNARHLSFAWGPHFCLGAPLARMEAAIALPRVLDRFPDLELIPGGAPWRESMAMRGLSELRARRAGVRESLAGVLQGT
jgi:pimeloyl-[acyl-carrier protein] synthase